ncbi:MAG: hypothetical protein JWP52_4375, partial [Rhizobacter sp.]|nr:hypothetical protein [Rhizobacter sp.]
VFGPNEWAARVAPWMGASLMAFGLYLYVRRWAGERMARASVLVLATQPLFFGAAQFANLDMLVAGCIGLTVLAAAHAAQCAALGLPHRRWLLAACAFAAFGVLAKGLIGGVLPVLVLAAWLGFTRQWRLLPKLLSMPGLLVFLAIAAPWFVAMQSRFPDFFHYFFVVQHFQRFAGGGFNNERPFWFFVPVLLGLALPWTAWLWRAIRPNGDRMDEPGASALGVRSLMWAWLAVVLVFFSLPSSKLATYILPATPPLAFLVAEAARAAWTGGRGRPWWTASAALAATVCVGVVAVSVVLRLPSDATLAKAYANAAAPDEPLVFMDAYFFDAVVYATLREPVQVVDDWGSPGVGAHDNWQRELLDAATFASPARRSVLVVPEQLAPMLCEKPVHWLMAPLSSTRRFTWLAGLAPVASTRKTALWRIDRDDAKVAAGLSCRIDSAATRSPRSAT